MKPAAQRFQNHTGDARLLAVLDSEGWAWRRDQNHCHILILHTIPALLPFRNAYTLYLYVHLCVKRMKKVKSRLIVSFAMKVKDGNRCVCAKRTNTDYCQGGREREERERRREEGKEGRRERGERNEGRKRKEGRKREEGRKKAGGRELGEILFHASHSSVTPTGQGHRRSKTISVVKAL